MQRQENPNTEQQKNNAATSAVKNQEEKQNVNNPSQEGQGSGNDDYRRDGAHLGENISETKEANTTGSTQKGGGGAGYDVNREQQEVNREQEIMHNERDNEQLNPERTQTPQPEITPGRENPGQQPSQPETRPGTSTMGSFSRNVSGAWSQSSWDANSIR